MKKVLMVILILLFLAGIGVGGYFVYTHFIGGGVLDVSSGESDDGSFQFSKQESMKEVLKGIKEVAGKKNYKECVTSLDACINDFLGSMPESDVATIQSLLTMSDYSEVSLSGADGYYPGAAAYYQVCYYEDGYYSINMDSMTDLIAALSGTEEETAETMETESVADETTVAIDAIKFYKSIVGPNKEPNGIETFNMKVCSYIQEMLSGVEAIEIGYEKVDDTQAAVDLVTTYTDEQRASVKEFLDSNTNKLNTTDTLSGIYASTEGDISLVYTLDGKDLRVIDIKADGNFNDYTEVLSLLHEHADWAEFFYNYNPGEPALTYSDDVDVSAIAFDWLEIGNDGYPVYVEESNSDSAVDGSAESIEETTAAADSTEASNGEQDTSDF